MNARLALSLGVLALVVVACAGAAPAPTPSAPPVTEPPVTSPPDTPIGGDPGVIFPNPGGPVDLLPKPGTRDPRPVNIDQIEARLNGDRIAIRLTWTSGVEPCYVFDSVGVVREGSTITVTVREGSGEEGVACIEIAQIKTTVVDLGAFEPGTYTIQASQGSATPVEVVVP